MSVDASNKFMVAISATGGDLWIMFPPRGDISREDALLLAAWLVALADPSGEEFPQILSAVQNS